MHIGKRTLKTGLAVLIAILVADLMGQKDYFVLVFTALVSVESTIHDSYSNGVSRFAANAFGALIALFMSYTGLPVIVTVPLAIILLILINNKFVHISTISTAAAIMIIILFDKSMRPETIMLIRLKDTLIGSLIGTGINLLIFPPKLYGRLKENMKALSVETHAIVEKIYLYGIMDDLEEYRQKIGNIAQDVRAIRNEKGMTKELSDPELKKLSDLIFRYQKIAIYAENLSLMDKNSRVTGENKKQLIKLFGLSEVIGDFWDESEITKDEVIYNFILGKLIKNLKINEEAEKELKIENN